MTYTHLTPNELVIIEAYFHQETPVAFVAKKLKRGRQAIYNVYHFLKQGKTALEYLEQYKKNLFVKLSETTALHLHNSKRLPMVSGSSVIFWVYDFFLKPQRR